MPRSIKAFGTISGVAFGAAAGAFLSLIPLYHATQTVEAWVKPTYWVVGIASTAIGVVCYILENAREEDVKKSVKSIQDDMQMIHETCFPDERLDGNEP